MNRTRALIIIGGFMLALAILAALELRKDDPVISEGQMVTGSVDKTIADAPGSDAAQDVPPAPSPDRPAPAAEAQSPEGSLVPLDSGTLRAPEEGAPATQRSVPAVPADPAAAPPPAAVAQPSPTPAVAARTSMGAGESTGPGPAATTPAVKPSAEPKETPARQKDAATEAKPLIITTKAPVKLQGKQKAITRTRLELGKAIVFRLTGAAPLTAKTLLLTSPERYVVDVQGEWGIALPKIPKNLLLAGIRAGQRPDAMRLVLELKRKPESAELVKIDAKTIEVRIR